VGKGKERMWLLKTESWMREGGFAQQRHEGLLRDEAIIQARPTRLRPILMTTLAMILGMLPTALARGGTSESRTPLGLP